MKNGKQKRNEKNIPEIWMITMPDITNEKVRFIDHSTNEHRKKQAFRVGEHLLVSYIGDADRDRYQIFKTVNGKPLFPAVFTTHIDAIQFAEYINSVYGEYLLLLYNYPDADIFGLAKWSVRNGIRIYETINQLNQLDGVKGNIISGAYKKAAQYVSKWTRNLRPSIRIS